MYAYNPATLYGKATIDGEAAAGGHELRGKYDIDVVEGIACAVFYINVDVAGEKTSRFGLWDVSTGLTHELEPGVGIVARGDAFRRGGESGGVGFCGWRVAGRLTVNGAVQRIKDRV